MGCIRSKSKDVDISTEKNVEVKVIEKPAAKDEAAPSNKALEQLREECVKAHNKYRAIHQSPPLSLKTDLNEMAQKWAEHLATIRTLQHSSCKLNDKFVGENIAYKWMSDGGEFTGQEVTDNWYSEIDKYDYSVGRSQGTGHFTQVVWKSSLEIGVGMDRASDGSFYVVANYSPAGNVIGQFEENVLKPK